MRVKFSGVGEAREVNETHTLPVCPREGEEVCFGSDENEDGNTWSVRTVVHYVNAQYFDVYCVVGPPRRY